MLELAEPLALADAIEDDAASILDEIDHHVLHDRSVLITGATGQVGVYLVAALRAANRRFSAGIKIHTVSRSAPPKFLAPIFQGAMMHHHVCDIADPVACRKLPNADVIIHAAGYGQPGKFLADPVKTIHLNTTATALLIDKLPRDGAFLFVSSSEIYSGSVHTPHAESDIGTTDPTHPRACYIEGKRCGEAICHAAATKGFRARIGRLALAYGPGTRTDDQRVLNSLIRRGLTDGEIRLMDQGRARRTYLYVADAAAMLLSILLSGNDTIYNVGGISTLTIFDLAHAISREINVPVSVPQEDAGLAGAPAEVSLDLSRYTREFGKTNFVSMDEGLRRTIAWQRRLYGSVR
ncbi:MAG: NAD-dependent epimerase/dehydratase family protein [Alphaproteobacteria bacterium]